jgi:hypothetical protein
MLNYVSLLCDRLVLQCLFAPFILPLRIGEENSPGARIAFRHNAEQGFD